MKRRGNDSPVGDVISLMLQQYGLAGRYREFRLLQSWSELMGPVVANRTDNLFIREKTLYVKINSAVLRNELSYGKQKIINMLNDEIGQELLSDIVFQ